MLINLVKTWAQFYLWLLLCMILKWNQGQLSSSLWSAASVLRLSPVTGESVSVKVSFEQDGAEMFRATDF